MTADPTTRVPARHVPRFSSHRRGHTGGVRGISPHTAEPASQYRWWDGRGWTDHRTETVSVPGRIEQAAVPAETTVNTVGDWLLSLLPVVAVGTMQPASAPSPATCSGCSPSSACSCSPAPQPSSCSGGSRSDASAHSPPRTPSRSERHRPCPADRIGAARSSSRSQAVSAGDRWASSPSPCSPPRRRPPSSLALTRNCHGSPVTSHLTRRGPLLPWAALGHNFVPTTLSEPRGVIRDPA